MRKVAVQRTPASRKSRAAKLEKLGGACSADILALLPDQERSFAAVFGEYAVVCGRSGRVKKGASLRSGDSAI